MKLRGPVTLAARVLLCLAAAACKDDDDFLIDDQRTDFQATLTAINDTIPILDPNTEGVSGEASFQVDEGDDLFTATVEAEGLAPSIEHLQFRDVVVDELRKRGGTLREEQLVDPMNPRWTLPGKAPVVCGK